MKIVGTGSFNANETTTTNSLMQAMLTKPEISVNLANLFEKNYSAFSSYLARKGLVKKGMYPNLAEPNFKVIGNRKFMWPLKGFPFRKGKIVDTPTSPAGYSADQLGRNNSIVILPLNTNWFSPNDVIELKDRRTHLIIMNEFPEEVSSGVYHYKTRLVTRSKEAFIPANLIEVDSEVGFSHTTFPEMSETGYEKNTFPEWHANYLTIQRMAFSISGSAKHTVLWIEHKGQRLWMPIQRREMMERWAYARENQLIYGRATIDANDNVYVRDLKGRDLVAGDGLLASADGSLKFQYNKLTPKVIEKVMQNMQLLANSNEMLELFVLGGQAFVWDFSRIMRDIFKFNPEPLFVSDKDGKGVDSTFVSYKMGGVKIITAWNPTNDAAWRPQDYDIYGVNKDSRRGIFVSLGNTIGGEPNVELCALGGSNGDRSFIEKVITGMVSDGEESGSGRMMASNSMDGLQVQILSETGIKVGNPYGVAELYVP